MRKITFKLILLLILSSSNLSAQSIADILGNPNLNYFEIEQQINNTNKAIQNNCKK